LAVFVTKLFNAVRLDEFPRGKNHRETASIVSASAKSILVGPRAFWRRSQQREEAARTRAHDALTLTAAPANQNYASTGS
jgi:hypothetical protein